MVSVTLVVYWEAGDKETIAAKPSHDLIESSPADLGNGREKTMQDEITDQQMVPKKKTVQQPVYSVSSLLQGARSRYSGVQKLLFSLLMASRKLRHYFQAHEITVVTRFSL